MGRTDNYPARLHTDLQCLVVLLFAIQLMVFGTSIESFIWIVASLLIGLVGVSAALAN
ncbi:hypothetical protein [Natranaeroarchaeum aerophilus]|uniref:Uncharacterized protein n=1 Tax=Natranaeroarchaeum aerophilus TaxID=2917711 RepID=A0AAE3FR35_9EURY|nr:hypothetical protein [Natranaeroarchaeum aerophilus]MCL9814102.1 hypothetical protein [Natranaeroarchaeum aerophilus]